MTNRTVGIVSAFHGSGATHFGIGLANYAASGLCQKTAYVDMEKAGQSGLWGNDAENAIQARKNVVYYSNFLQKDIPLLLNQNYQWVIFDFGSEYKKYREEFLRCDIKIAVLNLSSWQSGFSGKMVQLLRGQEWGNVHPQFICTFFDPKEKREFEKTYQEKIMEIPIFHHPFCIKKEQFDLMGSMLKEAAPKKFPKRLHIPRKERH